MASNYEVAENFAKQTGKKQNALSCSYSGRTMWSYGTVIAKLDVSNNTAIVSYNNMSNTTSKHIGNVRWALHQEGITTVEVPFQWGDYSSISCKELYTRYISDLAYMERNLHLAPIRSECLRTLENFRKFADYLMIKEREIDWTYNNTELTKDDTKQIKIDLERLHKLECNLLNPDWIKDYKKQRRLQQKQEKQVA